MPALAAQKIAIVGRLVETSPDKVLASLNRALAETLDDSALGDVRRLVEAEVAERAFRNAVFEPVVPMFVGAGDHRLRLTFPVRAFGLIWRGLRHVAGDALAEIRDATQTETSRPRLASHYDRFVEMAALGLRTRSNPHFAEAADLCDMARADGAASLLICLDIARVVRGVLGKLPVWLAHPGGESTAPARLAYNDAVSIADNSGQHYFEMVAAQLESRWMILRIMSAVMDKPTERYLVDTELAGFAEAVMAEVDEALALISSFDPQSEVVDGREAAYRAELAVRQIMEIENSISLKRERGWGRRIHKQRLGLANVVEARLRDADTAVIATLTMHEIVQNGVRRTAPCLSAAPDPACVRRAECLLSFSAGLRAAVNYGGFSAARAALIEKLSSVLDLYTDEAIQQVRSRPPSELTFAGEVLEVAARFSDLVSGEKAGELIRRRAQAALQQDLQNSTAGQ